MAGKEHLYTLWFIVVADGLVSYLTLVTQQQSYLDRDLISEAHHINNFYIVIDCYQQMLHCDWLMVKILIRSSPSSNKMTKFCMCLKSHVAMVFVEYEGTWWPQM